MKTPVIVGMESYSSEEEQGLHLFWRTVQGGRGEPRRELWLPFPKDRHLQPRPYTPEEIATILRHELRNEGATPAVPAADLKDLSGSANRLMSGAIDGA
jgi:hypothetical protein